MDNMKIAYLSSVELPSRAANSVHIMKMCQALSDIGNEVYLIGANKSEVKGTSKLENKKKGVYQFYNVDDSFDIISIPKKNIRILGRITNNIVSSLKALSLDPDIIYTRNIIMAFLTSSLGLPTIYESHVPVPKTYLGKYRDIFFKKIIKKNNFLLLIVISESIKNYYLDNYKIGPENILVARDASDPICYNESPFEFKNEKKLQVGYVGHLYPGKGMDVISELVKLCPEIMFHIVGGTEEDIRKWRNKLIKFDNVKFHGYKKQSEVVKYLKSFDVLLAPYKAHVHGFSGNSNIGPWMSPLKIFEYMAAGKPIIASDLPVIKEILTDEKTALLCSPENLNEWKEALEKLENPTLRKKLGKKARDEFLNKYTWEKRAEKIMNAVQNSKI